MSEKRERPLTLKQAQNCENAREPVCKCRCGGALHGAKRGGDTPTATFFETLPEDDPHYRPDAKKKAELANQRREAKNAEKREATRLKNERVMAAWSELYSDHPKRDIYEL